MKINWIVVEIAIRKLPKDITPKNNWTIIPTQLRRNVNHILKNPKIVTIFFQALKSPCWTLEQLDFFSLPEISALLIVLIFIIKFFDNFPKLPFLNHLFKHSQLSYVQLGFLNTQVTVCNQLKNLHFSSIVSQLQHLLSNQPLSFWKNLSHLFIFKPFNLIKNKLNHYHRF